MYIRENTGTIFSRYGINRDRLDAAAGELKLRLIVLFGSRAKLSPAPTEESDVDVAVLGCPKNKFWDCFKIVGKLFPDYVLDLVQLEGADPLFRYEIMNHSVLLWGDPDLYYEYRAYAYRDFIDSADLFQLENNLFTKKMKYLAEQLHG
ncbi:MAG: nucleotidyltransferase domain-containing protein [Spirochaetia bacterium]|nr:nucleotidyltransferase domain-containing protein [Spirochaetia bacterium]